MVDLEALRRGLDAPTTDVVRAVVAALPAGPAIILVAGLLYVWLAVKGNWRDDLTGGAIAGGLCALIGIALSAVLGDVPAMLLLFGTLSSIVTGVMGGAVGKLVFG